MLEKLQAIARRLDQVERQLSDPAIYADREMLTRLSREQKELTPIAAAFRAWQQAEDDCAQAQELLTDPEMRELAQEELHRARQERDRLSEELKRLLLPRDPNDDRNVILEVRAGIGGEEGALFAADLLRMYALYAERRPKLLLFSKVGVKRKMSGLDYSLAYSKLFREMIIRHAHRYVYADRPQKGMLALNARVVNRDIYEYEQQSIAGWHIENVEAERNL